VGKRNRNVGKELERQVVRDLQRILEPDLAKEIDHAREMTKIPPEMKANKALAKARRSEWTTELKRLQKLSAFRRGEQGRGAHEPDVVTPLVWWIECSRRTDLGALGKLAQAQVELGEARKAGKAKQWSRPVAVYRKTGSPKITVALELADLVECSGDGMFDAMPWVWELPVVIPYDAFLKLVEDEHARGQGS
jgi:hypothetical protein